MLWYYISSLMAVVVAWFEFDIERVLIDHNRNPAI